MTAQPWLSGDQLTSNALNILAGNLGFWDGAGIGSASVSGGTLNGSGPLGRGFSDFWLATAVGQTLTIDMGASRNLWGITYGTYYRGDPSNLATAIAVDTSPDNATWTNLATLTGLGAQPWVTALKPWNSGVTCRYMRITINGLGGTGQAYIAGLQVFLGDGGAGFGASPWLVDANGLPLSRAASGVDGHSMHRIATVYPAAVATVSLSSLPNFFRHLRVYGVVEPAAAVASLYMRVNGDSGNNYQFSQNFGANQTGQSAIELVGVQNTGSTLTFMVDIPLYSQAFYKMLRATSIGQGSAWGALDVQAQWNGPAAINALSFYWSTGNFVANGLIDVYGFA